MANNGGWIKLHRQIQDCALWTATSKEPFDRRSAWIDLLLMANHADKDIIVKGQKIAIRRGQKFTSIRKLSERWHWSAGKTKRYTELLISLEMIRISGTANGTLITIENYGKFQCDRYTERNTDGTLTDTLADTQTDYKQEYKKYKNDKEGKEKGAGHFDEDGDEIF